jgi:hypothetical protein
MSMSARGYKGMGAGPRLGQTVAPNVRIFLGEDEGGLDDEGFFGLREVGEFFFEN